MTETVNQRREPTARDYKLCLTVGDGRKPHQRCTLFNRGYTGTWRGEIATGVSAEVTRAGAQWQLTLSRGAKSAAFAAVTVDVSPFEVTFFVDAGWLPGGAEMVFATYA